MLLQRSWLPKLASSLLLAASLSVGVLPSAARAEHRDRHERREHRSDRDHHRDRDRHDRDGDRHFRDGDRSYRYGDRHYRDGDRYFRFRSDSDRWGHARWRAPRSGVTFRFAISNVAPVGYGYYDPYCDRDFDSLALYAGHLSRCGHPRLIEVIDAGAGCPVASYG